MYSGHFTIRVHSLFLSYLFVCFSPVSFFFEGGGRCFGEPSFKYCLILIFCGHGSYIILLKIHYILLHVQLMGISWCNAWMMQNHIQIKSTNFPTKWQWLFHLLKFFFIVTLFPHKADRYKWNLNRTQN